MKKEQLSLQKLLRSTLCGTIMVSLVACSGGTETAEVAEVDEVTEESTGLGEGAVGGGNWDNNRFGTTFASNNHYEEWDANDDSQLDENEFYGSYYNTWDINNDGALDEQEWSAGSKDYGLEGQNWSEWDANKDNKLEEQEFRTGLSGNNYYSNWDRDGDKMINEREYSDGLFGMWDNDRDGTLTDEEYNTRNSRYYGD